jgi:hypothetical protein
MPHRFVLIVVRQVPRELYELYELHELHVPRASNAPCVLHLRRVLHVLRVLHALRVLRVLRVLHAPDGWAR